MSILHSWPRLRLGATVIRVLPPGLSNHLLSGSDDRVEAPRPLGTQFRVYFGGTDYIHHEYSAQTSPVLACQKEGKRNGHFGVAESPVHHEAGRCPPKQRLSFIKPVKADRGVFARASHEILRVTWLR